MYANHIRCQGGIAGLAGLQYTSVLAGHALISGSRSARMEKCMTYNYISVLKNPPFAVDSMPPFLTTSGLTVQVGGKLVLDSVSLHVVRGDRVVVLGPPGAGKSMLLKTIAGLLKPQQGTINFAGHGADRHTLVSYIPSWKQLDWSLPASMSVSDVVMMGRVGQIGIRRWPGDKDRHYVQHCLEMVDMADYAHDPIGTLSLSQQQRMFLARALAQEADLILLDEPLCGLDSAAKCSMMQIIEEIHQRGVTLIVATEDLTQAASSRHYEQAVLLNRRIIASGPAREVFTLERLVKTYKGKLRWFPTERGTVLVADT
jgi:ABC-type Mn2+/Zn2+ transport system ATPase subunit